MAGVPPACQAHAETFELRRPYKFSVSALVIAQSLLDHQAGGVGIFAGQDGFHGQVLGALTCGFVHVRACRVVPNWSHGVPGPSGEPDRPSPGSGQQVDQYAMSGTHY
jgi:hypothetical protein